MFAMINLKTQIKLPRMKTKYFKRKTHLRCWGKSVVMLALMTPVFALCQEITPEEIAQAIGKNVDHPYLYFSADEVTELRERVTKDPSSREIYKELLAEANRLLYTQFA
jgi:hypothetical protein